MGCTAGTLREDPGIKLDENRITSIKNSTSRNLKDDCLKHGKAKRGSTTSVVSVLELGDTDIGRVRKLWMSDGSRETTCLNVIVDVLSSRPALLSHFNLPVMMEAEMFASARLKHHAHLLADFFGQVLDGLTEDKNVGEAMIQYVGAIHFRKGINFTAENYLVFKQKFIGELCAISARCNNANPQQVTFRAADANDEVAIHHLMNFLVKRLKQGFLEEATTEESTVVRHK